MSRLRVSAYADGTLDKRMMFITEEPSRKLCAGGGGG